jgi:hypothetical protein
MRKWLMTTSRLATKPPAEQQSAGGPLVIRIDLSADSRDLGLGVTLQTFEG